MPPRNRRVVLKEISAHDLKEAAKLQAEHGLSRTAALGQVVQRAMKARGLAPEAYRGGLLPMNAVYHPENEPPPECDPNDEAPVPDLGPSWEGWTLCRGVDWIDADETPLMFRWTATGVSLVMVGDTYSESDWLLFPPGSFCPCWKALPCDAHPEEWRWEDHPDVEISDFCANGQGDRCAGSFQGDGGEARAASGFTTVSSASPASWLPVPGSASRSATSAAPAATASASTSPRTPTPGQAASTTPGSTEPIRGIHTCSDGTYGPSMAARQSTPIEGIEPQDRKLFRTGGSMAVTLPAPLVDAAVAAIKKTFPYKENLAVEDLRVRISDPMSTILGVECNLVISEGYSRNERPSTDEEWDEAARNAVADFYSALHIYPGMPAEGAAERVNDNWDESMVLAHAEQNLLPIVRWDDDAGQAALAAVIKASPYVVRDPDNGGEGWCAVNTPEAQKFFTAFKVGRDAAIGKDVMDALYDMM